MSGPKVVARALLLLSCMRCCTLHEHDASRHLSLVPTADVGAFVCCRQHVIEAAVSGSHRIATKELEKTKE